MFIGHGNSHLWKEVKRYIEDRLHIRTVTYESEGHPGKSVKEILEEMLAKATFAVLIMTAEDETVGGAMRARQNVVHEAGYFQGVLGFNRALMLLESGTEPFSNIAGIQVIEFELNRISSVFWELKRTLANAGLLAKARPRAHAELKRTLANAGLLAKARPRAHADRPKSRV